LAPTEPAEPDGLVDPDGKPEPARVDATVSTTFDSAVLEAAACAELEDWPDEVDEDLVEPDDCPDSSWLSLASAVAKLAWASETCSCRDVVLSVAKVWPAVTCWPAVTLTEATVPPTWKVA
jgi:hypothetical protein